MYLFLRFSDHKFVLQKLFREQPYLLWFINPSPTQTPTWTWACTRGIVAKILIIINFKFRPTLPPHPSHSEAQLFRIESRPRLRQKPEPNNRLVQKETVTAKKGAICSCCWVSYSKSISETDQLKIFENIKSVQTRYR